VKDCRLSSVELFSRLVEASPELVGFFRRELSETKRFAHDGTVALSVGCGWGREIRQLAPSCGALVGVEIDGEELKQARLITEGASDAMLLAGDATESPFADEAFDLVLLLGAVFGNLGEKRETVLREVKRLLKPQGRILLSFYHDHITARRVEIYRAVGMEVEAVNGAQIRFRDGYVSTGFDKTELSDWFNKMDLNVEFIDIGAMGSLAVLSKMAPSGLGLN
jgi:ubiquinone/menaquinone biosynthesis C-methylase UbiE